MATAATTPSCCSPASNEAKSLANTDAALASKELNGNRADKDKDMSTSRKAPKLAEGAANDSVSTRAAPKVMSPQEWRAARLSLLEREKAVTRAKTELAAERAALGMVKMETPYTFDTPTRGRVGLAHLFNNKKQLIVHHVMFDGTVPPTADVACKHCSFVCDSLDGASMHLPSNNTSFVAVSEAPMAKILAYKKRMGWSFPWVSSNGTTFNRDFHVGFPTAQDRASGEYNYKNQGAGQTQMPGISVFYMGDDGEVYHTYSVYGRGLEDFIATYALLDITPLGRQETPGKQYRAAFKDAPKGTEWGTPINGLSAPMGFVKRHDEYPYFDEEDMGKGWL